MSITPRAHETDEEFYRRIYAGSLKRDVTFADLPNLPGVLVVDDPLRVVESVCPESEVDVDGPATLEDLELGYVRLEIYLAVKLRNRSWRLRSRLDISQVLPHPAERTPCARFSTKFVRTV